MVPKREICTPYPLFIWTVTPHTSDRYWWVRRGRASSAGSAGKKIATFFHPRPAYRNIYRFCTVTSTVTYIVKFALTFSGAGERRGAGKTAPAAREHLRVPAGVDALVRQRRAVTQVRPPFSHGEQPRDRSHGTAALLWTAREHRN